MDFLLQSIGLAYGETSLEDHGARFKPLINADMKQTSVKGLNIADEKQHPVSLARIRWLQPHHDITHELTNPCTLFD